MTDKTFAVNIAGVRRDLRLFEIKPGVRIAILNILGDTELVEAASRALAPKIAASHVMCSSPLKPNRSRWPTP